MSTCQSCDAEVVFVPSAKSGKAMILDATPEKRVLIGHVIDGVRGYSGPAFVLTFSPEHRPYDAEVAQVADVYVDHHATCPKADEWRGRTR